MRLSISIWLVLMTALIAGSPSIRAVQIPEPDAMLFGTVSIDRMVPQHIEEVEARLTDGRVLQSCVPSHASPSALTYVLRLKLRRGADGTLKLLYKHESEEQLISVTKRIDLYLKVQDESEIKATPKGIRLSARGEIRQLNLSLIHDMDSDGLSDTLERAMGLNTALSDSDGDGVPDITEVRYDGRIMSYDPYDPVTGQGKDMNAWSADTDLDGMLDAWELKWGLSPIAKDQDLDKDGDGYTNWEEFLRDSEPNDPNDKPRALEIYVDDNPPADPNGQENGVTGEGWPEMRVLKTQYTAAQQALKTHPYDTIQEAVDFAITKDPVWVREGIYTGLGNREIDLGGKAIRVLSEMSAYGPGHCIIDCQDQGRGFIFQQGEDPNTLIEGFTILHGCADLGAGMFVQGSSPTIRNCIIAKCWAQVAGGGIYCTQESMPLLEHVNVVLNDANGLGGGLYVGPGSHMKMYHSIIWDNVLLGDELVVQNICLDGVPDFYPITTLELDYCCLNPVTGDNSFSLYGDDEHMNAKCDIGHALFVDPLFADVDVNDFHLMSEHGRWGVPDENNPNTYAWLTTDQSSSPLIDAGDPNIVVPDQEIWPYGLLNIGAYGGTREASKSALQTGWPADLNKDGQVDPNDLAFLEAERETMRFPSPADLNEDLQVDDQDLARLMQWLDIGN